MDLALGHGLDLLVCHFDVFPETIKYQFPGPHWWLLFSREYQIFLTVDNSPFLADTEDHVWEIISLDNLSIGGSNNLIGSVHHWVIIVLNILAFLGSWRSWGAACVGKMGELCCIFSFVSSVVKHHVAEWTTVTSLAQEVPGRAFHWGSSDLVVSGVHVLVPKASSMGMVIGFTCLIWSVKGARSLLVGRDCDQGSNEECYHFIC